ncbi:MAG TPA: YciI family protein [Actinomycetota bacterium]|jgi:hypothetical protein|nr:YciI family protein [Actinomycetota bacterium]
MKYALLIYGDESAFADAPQEAIEASMAEWWDYEGQLQKAGGVKLAGEALQPTATGKSVTTKVGKPSISDGPFAETKEQLGGFYLLDVKDEDEAIEWALRCPGAKTGTIEVRPIQEFEQPQ